MPNVYEPGDVNIKKFTISNPKLNAELSVADQLMGFDVFEDITKPTMYAEIYIQDGLNLLEKFPIIGEETVQLVFQTPGFPSPARYTFRVFEVANVQKESTGKVQTYTLRCVSAEHFQNASTIRRSIEGTMSDAVESVVRKELKSSKPMIVDPAKGVQTLAVPTLNPLQTIDMCRQRAVSQKYKSSLYVFFENQAGFNFKTVEGLIEDGVKQIGSRVFNADMNTVKDEFTDRLSYRTLLQYNSNKQTDTIGMLQSGILSSKVKTFDLATKQMVEVVTDMPDLINSLVKTDKNSASPVTADFIKEFKGNETFMMPKSSLAQENFISNTVATRNAMSVLMDQNATRVLINGDSGIKAGDVITLSLPEVTGLTGKSKKSTMASGNYIVTRLRHIINTGAKDKHRVSIDCVKVGVTL